ncbi:carbohydrate ABC transporter permease [Paenibacillus sp. MWE-103]|uniref:Carbohydrate ABC transporter permease n=1 Tax=Paenibacillus artemisiicola TaxID=1172618 RepID=A0ABS3W7V2_9BACL|nr:carbohydrate ABC transporter permease [Paenibacillus artemisiicola]MBO7744378.1 carbohydrate ABC transporter permease [Paenibacillus artemisiicola]
MSGANLAAGSPGTRRVGQIIRFAFLLILSVSMIYPVLWMITIALEGSGGMFKVPPEWFPHEFHFNNFVNGAKEIDFGRVFLNSLAISVTVTIGQVISSLFIGYGIARIPFPGRKLWFYFFIGSMMLPSIVSLIPVFYVFAKIGLFNTWWPILIPAFFGNPFFIFLCRQFYSAIPYSYDEAAKIDGANHFQIMTRVIVPASIPLVVTMIILSFQGSWNEYLQPLVYLQDQKKWPLSVAVASFSGSYGTTWNHFMAVNLLYMLPLLILFFAAQKYFMQGLGSLNNSGLK